MQIENETKCSRCESDLVWEGSILTGKLVCKNEICKRESEYFMEWKTLNSDEYDGFFSTPAIPPPAPAHPGQVYSGAVAQAIMARYTAGIFSAHRLWCISKLNNNGVCDCGYLTSSPYDDAAIQSLEVFNYGLPYPTPPAQNYGLQPGAKP